MRRMRLKNIAGSVVTGIFSVFLFLLFYFALNRNVAPFIIIMREVFPLYEDGVASVINLYTYGDDGVTLTQPEIAENEISVINTFPETEPGDLSAAPVTEPAEETSAAVESNPPQGIIGLSNVIYQPGTDISINDNSQTELLTASDIDKFADFDYIKSKLYTVDKRTELLSSDIDAESYLKSDFKISQNTRGPKVLIFHTHSQESFSDSSGDINDGIFAVGDRLQELLETKYGIETLHDKSSYDIVDGKSSTLGAYERMEPSIREILDKNPSIELVLDMHRDGVSDNVHFVTNINGKPTAKVMFFNGLSRVYQNGELTEIKGLPNKYVNENLALSLKLQLMANELFPGLTRKIYINAYRYSLHFMPKSLLVEVGAQTNTKTEALNAMEPLAEIIAKTIK